MNKNLLILGAGGHGRVVKETAESMGIFNKIDFLDDNINCEVSVGVCNDNSKYKDEYKYAFPAFGNMDMRMNYMDELKKNGFEVPVLMHKTAYISPSATINTGTIVEAQAIINTNSIIGEGCIISVGVIVDHDSFVVSGCHIDCGAIVESNTVINVPKKVESGMVVSNK